MTSPTPPDRDARLAALLEWRSSPGAADGRTRLSQDDLEWIASAGGSTAESIRALPVGSRRLVAQLSEAIAACLRTVAAPAATPGAPAPAEGGSAAHDSPATGRQPVAPPPSGGGGGSRWDATRFAPFDPTLTPAGSEPATVGIHFDDDGRMSWSPLRSPDPVVVYRLVSADEDHPPAPEYGTLVSVGETASAVDERPYLRGVRYYGVWVNTGADAAAAYAAQPRLWARDAAVAPVRGCSIIEMDGQVIGNWHAAADTARVEVLRHPPGQREYRPALRLDNPVDPTDPQLGGFVDRTAVPGESYGYSIYAVALVDGKPLFSAPVRKEIVIPAVPDPVTDLSADQHSADGKSFLDVTWTQPPVGSVVIFLTSEEPDPALSKQGPIEIDRLSTTPLKPEFRIAHPPTFDGSRRRLLHVPWRREWFRAYVTPVTIAGGLAHVGPSRVFKRMDIIRDAELRERVDSQMVVFDWPDGAAQVAAFVTPPGEGLDLSRRPSPVGQLSFDDYERQGGLLLNLRGAACDVHLMPTAYHAGRVSYGRPETIRYPGLARVHYAVRRETATRKRFGRETVLVGPLQVIATADRDLPQGVEFAFVCRRDRMPLYANDRTEPPHTRTVALRAGTPELLFSFDGAVARGYWRLFGRLRSGVPLAVLDPDVGQLTA